MTYHDNAWDPSSDHAGDPHRLQRNGRGAHRVGRVTSAGVVTWAPGNRGAEYWANNSSPIPHWLAVNVGNVLGALSPGEKVNPFTGDPVPNSVKEEVIVESVTLAIAGVSKLAGMSIMASGDDIAKTSADLAVKGELNPLEINFSQRTVSSNVNQYVDDMASGNWDWSRSGPLRVMKREGQWVSYDNRRLMAAQNAGMKSVPVEIVDSNAIMPGSKKTWERQFVRRFNDPRNVKVGGPVPNQGLKTQPAVVGPRRR